MPDIKLNAELLKSSVSKSNSGCSKGRASACDGFRPLHGKNSAGKG